MRRMTAACAAAVVCISAMAACGPRQVDVRTAPAETAAVSIQVNNSLKQAVNLYTTVGGTDTFLRQIGPNQSATIPVPGVASGSTVTLKAVTVDGVHTYTRQNVTMNGTIVFPLP